MKAFFTSIQQGHKRFKRFQWKAQGHIQRGMAWFGRFLKPVMTLAVFLLGFSLFYIYITLRDNPKARRTAQYHIHEQSKNWHVNTFVDKVKQLAQLTTRNAKYTVLRDNMERLRLMLELYPVEEDGYPPDIATLYESAKTGKYWNLYKNPLSGAVEPYTAIVADYSDYEYAWERKKFKGTVLYQREGPGYRIYVCDEEGQLATNINGTFSISNMDE